MFPERAAASTQAKIQQALLEHRLPDTFSRTVDEYYWPICAWLASRISQQTPHLIGIQGSQGSGKSTCADFIRLILESELGLKVAVVSLDDYYLTKAQRQDLATAIHPLLATRGVPGTHELGLIQDTFAALQSRTPISVPRFNKASDDRHAQGEWQTLAADTDVLIFEGWCVGVPPQSSIELLDAANAFEEEFDSARIWRRYANAKLAEEYAALYQQIDSMIAIQAPSFDCVFDWRLKQEQKLISRLEQNNEDTSGTLNADQLTHFISHYQRITEHALAIMPETADCILYLNADHSCRSLHWNDHFKP